MSGLNDKLLEIKRQKDEYILPENIKKDVTVYGITGTLEAGSSGGNVKLFDTVEHMQEDENPQEGDLAIVIYRNTLDGIYVYTNNNWKLAPTQLTATPNYVYKQSFYGKNGVENGTLGTPNNSFADTNAEVYNKIQNQYENMEPRILTNDDETINKNMYLVPAKRDGTPLLDTSNVTNMYFMFAYCINLATIPELNTSNVTSMSGMFYYCKNLTTIPLLDTSNVTSMNQMFSGCTNLTTIPELNTSNVTNMAYMFEYCKNLTTIPELNTSNVTKMNQMFNDCPNLTDDSLNIIMQMCTNAVKITSNKTLKYIGLTQAQATTCQSLSNYQAFTNAGWTTGY